MSNISDVDPDDDDLSGLADFTVGKKIKISLADMDLPSWQRDLRGDLAIIDTLIASMDLIGPDDDAKLQHLKAHIREKIENPINKDNRKILIFTAFADTANYLFDNIAAELLKDQGLNTARVTGSNAPKTTLEKSYDFQSILTLFSPRAKEKHLTLPDDGNELDVLIGTDCLSEGQNLQDCDYLINYDIHWNPVRIIQRFGRIDRIGSPNAQIQLVQLLAGHYARRVYQSERACRKPYGDRRRDRYRGRQCSHCEKQRDRLPQGTTQTPSGRSH